MILIHFRYNVYVYIAWRLLAHVRKAFLSHFCHDEIQETHSSVNVRSKVICNKMRELDSFSGPWNRLSLIYKTICTAFKRLDLIKVHVLLSYILAGITLCKAGF